MPASSVPSSAAPSASHQLIYLFDTHPIQYRAPVFSQLQRMHSATQVLFFNESFDGNRWWFREVNKIPPQAWELSLRDGYQNEVLNSRQGLFYFFGTVARRFSKARPAAAICYGYYLPEHWILWGLCQWFRIPLVFIGETFTDDAKGWRRWVKKILRPIFFRGVSGVVSIGKRSFGFYRGMGISEKKITTANYCVDTSFFSFPEERHESVRRQVRQSLGIPPSAFVLLFVGRLFDRKRPLDIVDIYRRLAHHPELHVVMIGNGELESLLREATVKLPNVHFLGFKNQTETRDCYHAADLLLVPSEFETWGLVVNEAFCAGLPALVTDTCGVAGDLVTSDTGGVFRVGDLSSATAFVEKMIAMPTEHRRLSRNAKARALAEYDVEQFARAIRTAAAKYFK